MFRLNDRYPVPPTTPGKPGATTTPGSPSTPGDSVSPGDSVRPVYTGQKAQKEKTDQCLDQSELPVLNSLDRPVQLEHNVHKQPGNMPILQAELWSEHSEAFQDFTNTDTSNVKAYESPERTQLRNSGHRFSGIGHTGNPLGIGHTGNRSDQGHGSIRTRHHSDVSHSSRRDSNTHRKTISLRHADPGEHSPASMIRHRPAWSRSRSYDSVSPRRHSHSTSRSRGKKKKSHKKRKHSSTSSSSYRRSSSSLSRERERKRHKSKKKKKKHSKSLSSKRDKSKKKHKRKRSPSPSPSPSSSSDSSSSLQRSPVRKKSRIISRSPSPADDNPHSASRAASPASHRNHLSLYANNSDEFNLQAEDVQDLAPDDEVQHVSETQSDISPEYMGFINLIEEVFKLLLANMFPKKTEELLGGNRPRSSIELEIRVF